MIWVPVLFQFEERSEFQMFLSIEFLLCLVYRFIKIIRSTNHSQLLASEK